MRSLIRFRNWIRAQYYERKLGISTRGLIEARDLGGGPDSNGYSPLEYDYIFGALRSIPFPADDVVFLDYGAGQGRVLAVAATKPFRKVIGVEISGSLAAIARANLAAMKGRSAAIIEVHAGDAAEFALPDEVNVVFLFNPFRGQTLTDVIHRIECSWRGHPRELFIIAFNPGEFKRRVEGEPWLKKVSESELYATYQTT